MPIKEAAAIIPAITAKPVLFKSRWVPIAIIRKTAIAAGSCRPLSAIAAAIPVIDSIPIVRLFESKYGPGGI